MSSNLANYKTQEYLSISQRLFTSREQKTFLVTTSICAELEKCEKQIFSHIKITFLIVIRIFHSNAKRFFKRVRENVSLLGNG